jgi:hypothetical protein
VILSWRAISRARKTRWEFVMRDIGGVLIDLDGVVHEQFVWWGEKGEFAWREG